MTGAETGLKALAGAIRTRAETAAHSLLDEVKSIFHEIEEERQRQSRAEPQRQSLAAVNRQGRLNRGDPNPRGRRRK
jgi:hypothetical protein